MGGTGGDAPQQTPPRSRVVLYSSLAVGAVLALLIAVLAFSGPSTPGSGSSPLIGKAAPSVSGSVLVGTGQQSLAALNGKWVLVNFAASWCVPCRQETPQLEAFVREHAQSGDATILGVAFDPSDISNLKSFNEKNGVNWPAVNDPSAEVSYGVTQIPQSYLVDPAGRVVAKFFGAVTAAQLDAAISKASTPR
jgi:thiol-disulfide isomerase/thioredoxin